MSGRSNSTNKTKDKCIKRMKIDKRKIPTGPYCYRIKKVVPDPVYGVRLKTKECPYLRIKKINGVEVAWCDCLKKGGLLDKPTNMEKLIEHYGSKDAVYDALPLFLLFDGVKECGIKSEDNENR